MHNLSSWCIHSGEQNENGKEITKKRNNWTLLCYIILKCVNISGMLKLKMPDLIIFVHPSKVVSRCRGPQLQVGK